MQVTNETIYANGLEIVLQQAYRSNSWFILDVFYGRNRYPFQPAKRHPQVGYNYFELARPYPKYLGTKAQITALANELASQNFNVKSIAIDTDCPF